MVKYIGFVFIASCAITAPNYTLTSGNGAGGSVAECYFDGFNCGGDNMAGDPNTLYKCSGGILSVEEVCANGCQIMPSGIDDQCAPSCEPTGSICVDNCCQTPVAQTCFTPQGSSSGHCAMCCNTTSDCPSPSCCVQLKPPGCIGACLSNAPAQACLP